MSEKTPLVSIITGYYNRKENLRESVQSILNQTYQNFEYIIFDDCSTDGTYELLKEFDDPRLKLIRHENNLGFTKGIIQAVARSNAEFIAIHGAGDFSFPQRIQKQMEILFTRPEVGLVGCYLEDVSPEGTVIQKSDSGDTVHFTQGEVMYRKKLYFDAGGYNSLFRLGQFTLLKREILKISESSFVPEVLYRRIHFKDGVTKNPARQIEQKFYIQLGKEISEKGSLMKIDTGKIYLLTCLRFFKLLGLSSELEKIFLEHLSKDKLSTFYYRLYKKGLLGERKVIQKINKRIK